VLLQKPSDVRGIGWRRDRHYRLRLCDLGRRRKDGRPAKAMTDEDLWARCVRRR
jgi:hypothetical protein